MTRVAVFREGADSGEIAYRAVTGHSQAMGRTAGEALDALATQLQGEDVDTLVILRVLRPDRFFGSQQRQRLAELMAKWRAARDVGSPLPADEQTELENLIDAEVVASGERAAALHHELAR
jgi:hypothetical protein